MKTLEHIKADLIRLILDYLPGLPKNGNNMPVLDRGAFDALGWKWRWQFPFVPLAWLEASELRLFLQAIRCCERANPDYFPARYVDEQ